MSDQVNAWLNAQRDLIERWLSTPAGNSGAEQAQVFWRTVAQGVSPEARELATQLAELGPGFLAGASDALFELFGGPLNVERSNADAKNRPFGRWLELAPLGFFREQHAHAQELARAHEAYRSAAERMTAAIAHIHRDALELLAKKTRELAGSGHAVSDGRTLYNLWIECGERAFVQHASGEAFGQLQGELVNAGTRLRAAQQAMVEYFLKSLDLPTRAELNSVHKRLHELRDRIETLERQTAADQKSGGR